MPVFTTQNEPTGQGPPGPQLQLPVLQLFDLESHAAQALPPVPHMLVVFPGWQALAAQQPLHESTVHMHCPPTQARPEPQIGLVPHWHAPSAQWSAFCPSQPLQALPPVPQADSEGVAQVLPLQQLLGHELASQMQAPPEQRAPSPQGGDPPHMQSPPVQTLVEFPSHGWQAVPAVPHCCVLSLVMQVLPTQHPEQDWSLHTQEPEEHAWPAPQAELLPHWQVPFEVQPSARSGSHATQAPPAVPHVLRPAWWHDGPEQHPEAHVVALQPAQTPLTHAPASGHASHAPPATPH
jgi:hypothetical protein